ncbi:predicted protein [Sclerotinia sclerotiorum 1980 UF-70]|uniref:Uncharacterized protein n=1 Tax=Sclerotinia sclerotiorum (strain ATCC 18683 / 1980 / Ss-1) TaxID=665079 RepID=A7EKB7_SCLS1|nr:predicted protein [Sclerotinia sclerotiorum 1980 UF-70]EDO03283.1 predicted protein [Sclerotinia sclerotiorum 1980 UF-70]
MFCNRIYLKLFSGLACIEDIFCGHRAARRHTLAPRSLGDLTFRKSLSFHEIESAQLSVEKSLWSLAFDGGCQFIVTVLNQSSKVLDPEGTVTVPLPWPGSKSTRDMSKSEAR